MATNEDLQDMLLKREAELGSLKEERRDKDAAISFLKTKIVTLQNQSKVHANARGGGGGNTESPVHLQEDESAPRQIALQERDSHIADLEAQIQLMRQDAEREQASVRRMVSASQPDERDMRIAELENEIMRMRQETERSSRGVQRMVSGSTAWELSETRHRLAERDREVENLRRSLDWQERETKRIQECSAIDLEELRQLFLLRDREVAELKRAMQGIESKKREQHLEVELRRQAEQVRRLSSLGQRAEEDAGALQQQLRQAREEIAWLWQKLREQTEQQEEASCQAAPTTFFSDDLPEAMSPSSPSQPLQLPTNLRAPGDRSPAQQMGAHMRLYSERGISSSPVNQFTVPIRMRSVGDMAVSSTAPATKGPVRMRSHSGSYGAPPGAEAAAGDGHPTSTVPNLSVNGIATGNGALYTPASISSKTAEPPLSARPVTASFKPREQIPVDQRFERCEAADAGAGSARRSSGDDLHPIMESAKVDICTTEDLARSKVDGITADAAEEAEIHAAEESCELKPVCVTGGGALFSINFDDDEDMAAKEAKKQRVARQIERRRQAREAATSGRSRTEPGEELDASVVDEAVFDPELLLPPLGGQEINGSTSPRQENLQAQLPSGRSPLSSSRQEPVVTSFFSPATSPSSNSKELTTPHGNATVSSTTDIHDRSEGQNVDVESRSTSISAPTGGDVGAELNFPFSSKAVHYGGSTSPRQAQSPSGGSPLLSARLPPGAFGSSAAASLANGSEAGGKTPTLHSLAGLRDEMKRRRSKHGTSGGGAQAAGLQEVAEAVIAEANGNPPTSSRSVDSEGEAPAPATAPPFLVSNPVVSATAVAAVVSSAAAASAAASRVLVAGGINPHPYGFMGAGGGPATSSTSPLHSARIGAKSPGERIITTSSASAPPGAPVFDRLSSSGGLGSRVRNPASLSSPSGKAAPSSLFLPLGSPATSSAPLSPSRADKQDSFSRSDAVRQDPLLGSCQTLPGHQAPAVRQQPQRLRSMPQESSRAPLSSGGELDRSRRGVVPLSSRNVQIGTTANGLSGNQGGGSSSSGGGGSARFSVAAPPHDVPQRSGRPSVDGVGNNGGGDAEQDALHEAVVRFCMQRPAGRYPLVRLSRGVYLYGNKKLVVAVHNDKLMVRIGGGFVHLESYLNDCDRAATSTPSSPTAVQVGVHATAAAHSHFEPAPRQSLSGIAGSRSILASRRR